MMCACFWKVKAVLSQGSKGCGLYLSPESLSPMPLDLHEKDSECKPTCIQRLASAGLTRRISHALTQSLQPARQCSCRPLSGLEALAR